MMPENLIALNDSGIDILVEELDFTRLKYKLMTSDEEKPWTLDECERREREYKRFLTLIKLNPERQIIPTQEIDKFWHQHILDTKAYREDCQKVFGFFVDHFPYFGVFGAEDSKNLQKAFEDTQELYLHTFREFINGDSSRCKDHACHAESKCACRVSGACKNH